MASRISRTAERMTRMIRDLLDFTRGRLGGGIPVSLSPGDLGVVVSQVVDELRAAYPDRGFRLLPEGDLRGEWDSDRVAQAVMNLCTNAIQYATPGTPITVGVSREGDSVSVNVENRGDPIPDHDLENVFDPYRRLAPEGRSAGVGLGL
jgi:signal transduction histidine kinase